MTKKELIDGIEECNNNGTEEGHMDADELLLKYINDPEVTKAFRALAKWYA